MNRQGSVGKHGDVDLPAGESPLKLTAMKTTHPKMTDKLEIATAVFIVTALIFFFAVVIYNSFSKEIGL